MKISVSEFNDKIKKEELETLVMDSHNDLALINSTIAHRFMSYIADRLGLIPSESYLKNQSKNPTNHFQLECYLENGTSIWATFVYVNDNHKVVRSKCNVELIDSDYNTIKKLL